MGCLMYYQWNSEEDFNDWHNALCLELGYPEIVDGKVITDSYTKGFEFQGVFIAYVDGQYAGGLTPILYNKQIALELNTD